MRLIAPPFAPGQTPPTAQQRSGFADSPRCLPGIGYPILRAGMHRVAGVRPPPPLPTPAACDRLRPYAPSRLGQQTRFPEAASCLPRWEGSGCVEDAACPSCARPAERVLVRSIAIDRSHRSPAPPLRRKGNTPSDACRVAGHWFGAVKSAAAAIGTSHGNACARRHLSRPLFWRVPGGEIRSAGLHRRTGSGALGAFVLLPQWAASRAPSPPATGRGGDP